MANGSARADHLISTVISSIEDVKGRNISILDLRGIESAVCSYFIICEGNSSTQVKAIVQSIQKKVSKTLRERPWHTEGMSEAKWLLIDYVDVVVHIFKDQARAYYDLESLWGDAVITTIESNY